MKNPSSMHRLWKMNAPLRRLFVKASIQSMLNKIFDLAPPVIISMAVDSLVYDQNSKLGLLTGFNTEKQIYLLALLTVFIWVMESVFEYLFQSNWRKLAQKIQHQLRMQLYQRVLGQKMSFFDEVNSGSISSTVNDDINQLERFFNGGVNEIIQVVTTVVVIGIIFFSIAPDIAILSFTPIPIILWGSFYFQKVVAPHYAKVRQSASLMSAVIGNCLSGIQTVKSFFSMKQEYSLLLRESLQYGEHNDHATKYAAAFVPLIRMCVMVGFLFTLVLGAKQAMSGVIPVGDFSVLVFFTQRLLWPLTRLGDTFDLLQRSIASANKVFNLLDQNVAQLEDDEHTNTLPYRQLHFSAPYAIEISHLDFNYHQRTEGIFNIQLRIPTQTTLGIVGLTGSGKSTLLKLLLGLYQPSAGEIKLFGENSKNLNLQQLRSLFSYVGQESYLFHGSVRENVTYGIERFSEADFHQALELAQAQAFIDKLPAKLDTIVGERGQKLSGGQRQRLALARAILKNAPIFLFDEATSAVDNETEALIQEAIHKISQQKTMLLVAHRLSTVVSANSIIVMDDGRIIEQGDHSTLISANGKYRQLWQVQTGHPAQD